MLLQAFIAGAVVALAAGLALRRAGLGATLLVALTLGAATAVTIARQPASEPAPAAATPPEAPRGRFASSRACRSCHTREYATWEASFHRSMTRPPTDASVLPPWQGEITAGIFSAELFRKGDEFWVRTPDLAAFEEARREGRRLTTLPRLERRITLVTGSHHKQIYWYGTGQAREQDMFPFLWLVADRRWVPRDAAFMRERYLPPRREQGRWNDVCMECHTTGGRPRFADMAKRKPETDVVDHGIACEACHGPAAQHREAQSRPWTRYAAHLGLGKADRVVEPTDLSGPRSAQVCGQCHAVSIYATDQGWWEHNVRGPGFVPGEDLAKTLHALDPTEPPNTPRMRRYIKYNGADISFLFWRDGMVKVGGREYTALLATRCHTQGKGQRQLTCTHCHQMHPETTEPQALAAWADDQLAPGMRGDAACSGCHDPARFATESHTHHAAQSEASRCQSCHMPFATYTLLKATQNHRIDSPSAEVAHVTGRPDACSLCHMDKPLEWTAGHLNRWYGQDIPRLANDHRRLPAGLVWGLSGDALQRAIIAWNMGRRATQAASDKRWFPLVLAQRLVDPYPAVRYIAARSLAAVTDFDPKSYDFVGPSAARATSARAVMRAWSSAHGAKGTGELVFDGRFQLPARDFQRLLEARDDRRVELPE